MTRACSFEVRELLLGLVAGGSSVSQAAAVVGVSRQTGCRWWRESSVMDLRVVTGASGGLAGSPPPTVPGGGGSRQRRPLSGEDRAVIAVGIREGWSYRRIGAAIGRDPSVVCRELARNRGLDGSYCAPVAHRAAHERRRRPKTFKLLDHPELCRAIEEWMDQGWSPGLIAQVLNAEPDERMMGSVCHETIYQAVYVQARGHLRADLHKQLSLARQQRKPRRADRPNRSPYVEAFTIRERPAEAEDRAVPGHWEGDLILGPSSRSAIGTLVERSTRFTILLHLPGRHDASSVADAMIREMSHLPEHLRRSITWDRGTELADYARIQLELKAPVFFCDPHSPWQRGTNENTNRLLRFWFTKGTDLSVHTAEDLQRVADTLNRRPRPTLDPQTPAQRLNQLLATQAAA